jgi:hypothetical protein
VEPDPLPEEPGSDVKFYGETRTNVTKRELASWLRTSEVTAVEWPEVPQYKLQEAGENYYALTGWLWEPDLLNAVEPYFGSGIFLEIKWRRFDVEKGIVVYEPNL